MKKQLLGWVSISDDDLCSSCVSLLYRPGGFSYCQEDWPCALDENSYIESCDYYLECVKGTNIAFVNIRLARAIWKILGDLPTNEDGGIEEQFLYFPVGTHREEIWRWIELTLGPPAGDLMHNKIP